MKHFDHTGKADFDLREICRARFDSDIKEQILFAYEAGEPQANELISALFSGELILLEEPRREPTFHFLIKTDSQTLGKWAEKVHTTTIRKAYLETSETTDDDKTPCIKWELPQLELGGYARTLSEAQKDAGIVFTTSLLRKA